MRQLIFANVAPTAITRVFISHFHGDHCIGLLSMFMRFNLDKITHPIHCYYPASGKKYFDRLRFGCIYHDQLEVIEHPVHSDGLVEEGPFKIEAKFLQHGVDTIAWRITEADTRKFDKEKLRTLGVRGPLVRQLEAAGTVEIEGKKISLDDVSWIRKGDAFAVVIDTRLCPQAVEIARGAKMLLCESTYLNEHEELAFKHNHLTAAQAATIAKDAGVEQLVLTHFSARYLNLKLFLDEARPIFPNTDVAEDLKVFPFQR